MKLSTLAGIFRNRSHLKELVNNHLHFLENADTSFWGSITREDMLAIIKNVEKAATYPGSIIEIGALFGFTTQLIAAHKPKEKPLIAVELFCWNPFGLSRDDHKLFIGRVLYYSIKHCNTSIHEGSNQQFYQSFAGEKPAMIFIDADHTYEGVMVDIAWAKKMEIPVICGHDYSDLHPGVIRAVKEAFGDKVSVTGSVWTVIRD